jgi:hypothetical protein
MGRLENDGNISAQQMTEDLNTKNPLERARLIAKQEEFAIVGERVLGQTSMSTVYLARILTFLLVGQIGVTRCMFNFNASP